MLWELCGVYWGMNLFFGDEIYLFLGVVDLVVNVDLIFGV